MSYRVAICRGYANAKPSPYDGQYLAAYHPHRKVKGSFTTDLAKAKRYATPQEFFYDWNRSIGTRAWDGKPDRPLTAFNLEVVVIEEEADREHDDETRH